MPKIVDLDPVLRHITKKLMDDREALNRLLLTNEPDVMKEFEEQERLLDHIQAAVRALDLLEGATAETAIGPHQNAQYDAVESLLAEAFRPNGAAH